MSGYDFQNLNVLVVDDNKYMRDLVRTILHALGVKNICEAADGAQAFERLTLFPADLAICDLMMVPLDGLDFVRMLRTAKDSPNPFLPVIMLTGHTELPRIREVRDAGAEEILAKPISTTALYGRMVELVENPRSYVRTKTYFGPDRRRWNDPNYRGSERRTDSQPLPAAQESRESRWGAVAAASKTGA